jgi:hypothetical protein
LVFVVSNASQSPNVGPPPASMYRALNGRAPGRGEGQILIVQAAPD